jgi:hypothetical protein
VGGGGTVGATWSPGPAATVASGGVGGRVSNAGSTVGARVGNVSAKVQAMAASASTITATKILDEGNFFITKTIQV